MRGRTRRDWREGRYMIHFSTGDAAMRFYDEQLEIGAVIESGLSMLEAGDQAGTFHGRPQFPGRGVGLTIPALLMGRPPF